MADTQKVTELKDKIRKVIEDLKEKRNELERLHNDEMELVSAGLDTPEKRKEFRDIGKTRQTLRDRIKEEAKELEGLLESLKKEQRTVLGWIGYVLIWPFSKIWALIKGLIRALEEFDDEQAKKLIESLIANAGKFIN